MTTFEGYTALVTGASGGIGRKIAERLAGPAPRFELDMDAPPDEVVAEL